MVNVVNETNRTYSFDTKLLCENLLEALLDIVNCPYEATVDVLLTDAETVHEINLHTRKIDRTTDVLSFPANDITPPEQFVEETLSFDPDTGHLLLGDIVLNVQQIDRQAEEFGHSVAREFAFLVTHSLLHLLGHDHMEQAQEQRMRERQREILSRIGVFR